MRYSHLVPCQLYITFCCCVAFTTNRFRQVAKKSFWQKIYPFILYAKQSLGYNSKNVPRGAPGKMVHESIHFFNPGILDLLISSPYFVNCSVYRYLVVTVLVVVTPTTSNTASFSKAKMSRRYDSSTTTFSPEGRLHQVRFATVVYMESFITAANLLIWYVFPHFLVGGICYRSHQ